MIRSYAVVTPARDEAANLSRLASCLAAQTIRPRAWNIVDNGSSDGPLEIAQRIAAEQDWVHVLSLPGTSSADRGARARERLHPGP